MTLKEAIVQRNAPAIGVIAERLRSVGATYHQLFARAQQHDPSLDLATWDALLREFEESE